MNFIRQIERLQLLTKLIEQERTGTPEELGKRLGIKKRTLFDIIDNLKSLGVQIEYNRRTKTYSYAHQQKIHIEFSLTILKESELKKISGGVKYFSLSAFFLHREKLTLSQYHWFV